MTALLAPAGGKNILAVRVNNTGSNSRWYSGSGLFRPVSLLTAPAIHTATWGGVYITTPNVKLEAAASGFGAAAATVEAETTVALLVQNDGKTAATVAAGVKIYRTDDKTKTAVATSTGDPSSAPIPAGGALNVTVRIPATKGLAPWGPSSPVMYTAEITIKAATGGTGETVVAQVVAEEFGYRSFSFDATTGFTINGEQMKLCKAQSEFCSDLSGRGLG